MEKVVKIISLRDIQNDFEYWMSKTDVERINAIEFLRNQYIKYNTNVEPRLQRVCSIVNRKQSWLIRNKSNQYLLYNPSLQPKMSSTTPRL
jgi:hypothetical protein